MNGQAEVGEARRVVGDDGNGGRDSPQHIELPYDDGAALDDQPALIRAIESPGLAAGDDRRAEVGRGHADIMTEAHLGRLLPACLHQAIADALPQRLEFYEEWLDPVGLRNGSIGLAPISAVIGFLRTEGDRYDAVVSRAGQLAAQWSIASRPPYQRRLGGSLPVALRWRFALRVAGQIARDVLSTSSVATKVRRGRATMRVQASIFCSVREKQAMPMCGFYRALALETLRAFHIAANARIDSCRAISGTTCEIALEMASQSRADEPAMAA